MTEFNVALFGAGRIGSLHAKNIVAHQETKLQYVIDTVKSAASTLANHTAAAATDQTTAITDPTIDAIVICSDTSTHAELIERGIDAGKAVFCEKPIDLDIKRVRSLLSSIENTEPALFVAFNRRFDPSVAEVKRRASKGELGDIELVTVISKDPDGGLPIGYLQTSGGLFRDMTIHDFDMARFLLDEEPSTVSATAASLVSPEIAEIGDIDTASITMQTASGKIAVITNSRRCCAGYDQRVEVHGSKGTARTHNIPKSMFSIETAAGTQKDNPKFFFTDRYAEAYALEWARFVEVLRGEAEPEPTGVDGYRALLLAEAAYLSLEQSRTVTVEEAEYRALNEPAT